MLEPTFKCLFCGSTNNSFNRVEHIIPESMGNDETILPKGFVCDPCNNYFGLKVEKRVLNIPPFNVEKILSNVKTKKKKDPKFDTLSSLKLYSTGYRDRVLLIADPKHFGVDEKGRAKALWVPRQKNDDYYIMRFLLKVGLELLILHSPVHNPFAKNDVEPYQDIFDQARKFARYGTPGMSWEFAHSIYPRREDLTISVREDEFGQIDTHQLYQIGLGGFPNGDIGFSFTYAVHHFACNLTSPSINNYVEEFNEINDFEVQSYLAKLR